MSTPVSASPPDILSPAYEADPPGFFRLMRDDFSLIHHEASGFWFLSRHADVSEALGGAAFSTRHQEWQMEPVIGRSLGAMTGREHATQRALVAPAFRGKELGTRFLSVIEQTARDLIGAFPEGGRVDLVDSFTSWFPINVIASMLGLPKGNHRRFHDWYSSFMAFLSNITQDPEVIAWGERTKREFPEYILPIIAERRANPGDDLLSRLCTAEIDGERMTDDQIRSFVALLLIAGGETTDKVIASILKNLLENPEQLAAVRADRSLIANALAETLRFAPPVNIVLRTAEEEVEIPDGGTIPANSTVACVIGAANRDERRFADPDRFDIFREDLDVGRAFGGSSRHLAFGHGRHFCVGSMLAKAQVETGVSLLLDLMPDMRFATGFTPRDEGLYTRAPASLWVEYTPA